MEKHEKRRPDSARSITKINQTHESSKISAAFRHPFAAFSRTEGPHTRESHEQWKVVTKAITPF
jgi:hypothetical protein